MTSNFETAGELPVPRVLWGEAAMHSPEGDPTKFGKSAMDSSSQVLRGEADLDLPEDDLEDEDFTINLDELWQLSEIQGELGKPVQIHACVDRLSHAMATSEANRIEVLPQP